MTSRARHCALVAFSTAFVSSCAQSPRSCDLDTSALVMLATVSDTDDGVEVEVEFATDSAAATALALCPGSDVLTINGVEATEQLTLGHLYYTAQFEQRASSFEILLERKERTDVSATIEVPPDFEVSAPIADSEQSRASELTISWGPAWLGNEIVVAVEDEIGSTCIDGLGYFGGLVEDSGTHLVGVGELSALPGARCEVKVSLTRLLESSYPDELASGGSLTAIVNRRLPFESID